MELWDIYDKNKKPTGRTMKRNDWTLKDGEYHLSVLGVISRPDGKFLITQRVMTKAWAPGWWEVSGGAAQAGEDGVSFPELLTGCLHSRLLSVGLRVALVHDEIIAPTGTIVKSK